MSQTTDQVDELFAFWNRPDSPGCSLAVIKDGEIIYKQGVRCKKPNHWYKSEKKAVFGNRG